MTEELFDGDKHLVFHSPSLLSTPENATDPLVAAASALGSSPHYLSSVLQPPGNPFIHSYHTSTPAPNRERHRGYDEEAGDQSQSASSSRSQETEHDVKAHEYEKKQRLKQEAGHDKRKAVEKALKETTVIEFFEREKVPDEEDIRSEDMMPEGSERRLYFEPRATTTHHPNVNFYPQHQKFLRESSKPAGNSSSFLTQSQGSQPVLTEYTYHPQEHRYVANDRHPQNRQRNLQPFTQTNHWPSDTRHEERVKKSPPLRWKEHGYRITQEVEYLDRDAAQEKGFLAKDKGRAEHVKDLMEKEKHHMSDSSEVKHHDSPEQEDNPLNPSGSHAGHVSETDELPSLASAVEAQRQRKQSRVPTNAYNYGKAEYMNKGTGYIASQDIRDYQRTAESAIHMRREDAPKSSKDGGFLEIQANVSFTTSSPAPVFYHPMPSTTASPSTTTTGRTVYAPMRKPPDSVNALTIVESPSHLNASHSHNNDSHTSDKWTGTKKFSKVISVQDPVQEAKRLEEARKLHNEFMRLLYDHPLLQTAASSSLSSPSSLAPLHASPITPSSITQSSMQRGIQNYFHPFLQTPHHHNHHQVHHNHNLHASGSVSSSRQQAQHKPVSPELPFHQNRHPNHNHHHLLNHQMQMNHQPNLGYDINNNNVLNIQKLMQGLHSTGGQVQQNNGFNSENPLLSLQSMSAYTRPSVLKTLTSSGKSVFSRLRNPLQKLPSMKRLRFGLPSSLTASEEEKQETEAMKSLSHMDTERVIASLLQSATGERRMSGWSHVTPLSTEAFLRGPKKEIEDRNDFVPMSDVPIASTTVSSVPKTTTSESDTVINPSLLSLPPHLEDVSPVLPIKSMAHMYSQPLVLKNSSPARRIVDALKNSLWVAADPQRRLMF